MFEELRRAPVRDFMTEPTIVPSALPVSKALGLMRNGNLYEIFVDDGEKVGMATVRDFLRASDITSAKLSLHMTYVPKLPMDYPVGKASRIMARYRIRALPVADGEKVVGKVSVLPILKAMDREMPPTVRVGAIMTPNPITIDRNEPVSKARAIMERRKIDHLPVLSDRKVYGIVTSTNLVFNYIPPESLGTKSLGAEKQRKLDFPVDGILTREVMTCASKDTVKEVLSEVLKSNSTYALATLWEEVQGIVTYGDVVKLVSEEESHEEVPAYIVGLPEDPLEAELAKDKFRSTIALLKKAFPEIEEARSKVKVKDAAGERRRYEVNVMVHTPYRFYTYTESGWDLPRIYDVISYRLKRILSQRPSRKKHPSRADYP